ncbi:MAG TPA: nucleic acid-binding protein [Planctomycetota bacterium]|jgi:predicted nucleic acid-binding protein
MGEGEITDVVADAGPIIHLYEIRCLSLLGIFERVLLPDAVLHEVCTPGRVPNEVIASVTQLSRTSTSISVVESYAKSQGIDHLQAGELACFALCEERGIRTLLTDDLAARDAAARLGITAVGSVGIIARAYRSGLTDLSTAEQSLRALQSVSTLFVTPELVETAVRALRTTR